MRVSKVLVLTHKKVPICKLGRVKKDLVLPDNLY